MHCFVYIYVYTIGLKNGSLQWWLKGRYGNWLIRWIERPGQRRKDPPSPSIGHRAPKNRENSCRGSKDLWCVIGWPTSLRKLTIIPLGAWPSAHGIEARPKGNYPAGFDPTAPRRWPTEMSMTHAHKLYFADSLWNFWVPTFPHPRRRGRPIRCTVSSESLRPRDPYF